MTAKLIKVSPTKAYRVEGIIASNGEPMISIRQMYATKKDPKFKFGRQGVTIDVAAAQKIFAAVRDTVKSDIDTYTDLRD